MRYVLSKFDESIQAQGLTDVSFPINGSFVLETPDGVQIVDPTSYADLKAQKIAGIQGLLSNFTDYVYDEFDSDAYIDYTTTDLWADVGKYAVKLNSGGGRITTTSYTLSYAPSQISIFWSVHTLSRTLNSLKGQDVGYTPQSASDIVCEVSFDGGATYEIATYGSVLTPAIPTVNMILRFTRSAASDRYIGYYAVLYRV